MSKIFRTILLKLYKPSNYKACVLEEAFTNYNRALEFLLHRASDEREYLRSVPSIEKHLQNTYGKQLNDYFVEPFKDSLIIDAALNISESLKHNLDFKEIERLHPIYFCRYSKARNYSLLYDKEKDKYFAKLYLMNVKDEKRKAPIKINEGHMLYIDKVKTPFIESLKKRSYLLFPLAFGKYQEAYLKEALNTPEIIKTARLIKSDKEYYLAINIVKTSEALIPVKTYLGVSRGIISPINLTVVEKNGDLVYKRPLSFPQLKPRENEIHEMANQIINIGSLYKCQIIVENLSLKGDNLKFKLKEKEEGPSIIESKDYNKLINILSYKVTSANLPPIIKVSSRDIFYKCPFCGINEKTNRFFNEFVVCTSCGNSMKSDEVGGINLARKLIYYAKTNIKIKVKKGPLGFSYTNKDLGLEYYPKDSSRILEDFQNQIRFLVNNFYDNIEAESKNSGFKKKFSLMKKIESNIDCFQFNK